MECKICGKTFTVQRYLSKHRRTHDQTKVQCPCGRSFSRRDNLKRHQFLSQTCRALEESFDIDHVDNRNTFKTEANTLVNNAQISNLKSVRNGANVNDNDDEEDDYSDTTLIQPKTSKLKSVVNTVNNNLPNKASSSPFTKSLFRLQQHQQKRKLRKIKKKKFATKGSIGVWSNLHQQ